LVVPVWFNPWQHQQAELPVVGLLHELREQFTTLLKVVKGSKKLVQVSVEAALPLLDDLASAISGLHGVPMPSGMGSAVQGWGKKVAAKAERDFRAPHDAQRLNLLFEEAVLRLLGATGDKAFLPGTDKRPFAQRRLVILVDDLDRCGEHQTVHLLEAIKLYLQTPYCVFVLGMDGAAARRAVGCVLKQGEEVAREYLEKLFQATLHVPLPVQPRDFVVDLLEAEGLDEEATGLKPEDLARRIEQLVEPNPRKLKTFVNGLSAGWTIDREGSRHFDLYLLFSYLRTVHPDVYRLLSHSPSDAFRLHSILAQKKIETRPSPVDYFLQRAFRHAFDTIEGLKETPERPATDLVVDELIERLDHFKGDCAFRAQWLEEVFSGDTDEDQVIEWSWRVLRQQPPPKNTKETA
jgi:hypothetical protein